MDRKLYRNAIRSKKMIRSAFLELLAEKPLEKITIVDIVNRSNLSRNTFYAHYQDIYAVLEEFQSEMIQCLKIALDEAVADQIFDAPMPLLQQMAAYIDADKDTYRVLLRAGQSNMFINKLKAMLIEHIINHFPETGIQDQKGFLVFMDVLTTGFIHLFQLYLREEIDMSSNEIVNEINKIYLYTMPVYRLAK